MHIDRYYLPSVYREQCIGLDYGGIVPSLGSKSSSVTPKMKLDQPPTTPYRHQPYRMTEASF